MSNLAAEMHHGATVDNYDPLMAANFAIWENCMRVVGLEAMAFNDDGTERCPLCFMNEQHLVECKDPNCSKNPKEFDSWIEHATKDQVRVWKELNEAR